jgi:hypothetical protein
MFLKQLVVLGNVSIIEIGDSKVEEYVEEEGKVENHEVKTVFTGSHGILNPSVDTENPKRFNQQIEEKNKNKV